MARYLDVPAQPGKIRVALVVDAQDGSLVSTSTEDADAARISAALNAVEFQLIMRGADFTASMTKLSTDAV